MENPVKNINQNLNTKFVNIHSLPKQTEFLIKLVQSTCTLQYTKLELFHL